MLLRQIEDPALAQYAYLIGCQRSGEALVIDPERDIARYHRIAAAHGLRITAVAETHIHADFVSGAREFSVDPAITLYLSAEGGPDWTYRWPGDRAKVVYLRDGDTFRVGNIDVRAVHTPGHTPEHLSYLLTDRGGGADEPVALATGDFLFVGDVGRPDLLETAAGVAGVREPSARQLRESLVTKLPPLPGFLQILPGHGSGSACGKALGAVPTSVLDYERHFNRALRLAESDREEFVRDILSGQPEPPPYFARMKAVNRDGIAITGGPAVPAAWDQREVAAYLQSGRGRILDTRADRAAFDAAHLPGSLHAPYPGPFVLTAAGSYLEPEDEILLVVTHPADAVEMATQLYRIGFDRVVGFVPWSTAEALASGTVRRVDFGAWTPQTATEPILDVRTAAEFAAGHLPSAINIPYTRLKPRLAEVPRGTPLAVHCGTGKRASLAASFLRHAGIEATHVDGVCAECDRIAEEQGMTH
jgi:hydroxyacylglutathione hydrolase